MAVVKRVLCRERLRRVPLHFSWIDLDRLLHHAETIVLEGKSYRMKDRIEP